MHTQKASYKKCIYHELPSVGTKGPKNCTTNVVIHINRSFRPTLELIMLKSLIIGLIIDVEQL